MSALTDIFFGNIYITLGWAAVLVVVLVVRAFQYVTRHEYVVAQVSEVDHMGEFLEIDAQATSSTCIRTTNNRRFYRTAGGYLIKASRYKNYTLYLGKLGTGYAFEPDQTKENRDLFDVMGSVLGPVFMNQLEASELKLIQESKFQFNEDTKVGT